MSKKPRYIDEEDDGRTIADMSGVSRQPLFLPRLPEQFGRGQATARREDAPGQPGQAQKAPWVEEERFSPEEQRWAVLGALKAALLIGAAFVAGLGLVVLLFVWAA